MTFFELITKAIADIEKHGFDSEKRLQKWIVEIVKSAKGSMVSEQVLHDQLRRTFGAIYEKALKSGQLLKVHPGVSVYDLSRVKPKLHAELQRRMMASSELIRLNRESMVDTTVRRFSGWATSIPAGGTKMTDITEVKAQMTKALRSLPFTERRVMIDQGQKFTSALNDIVATDQGAIAAKWRSHYRQAGYNYREDHKERDGQYYAIRGSWALEKGLMNKGSGYTDDMTMPGEEVYCRCAYTYVYNLRDLPPDMLTKKGREKLDEVKNLR